VDALQNPKDRVQIPGVGSFSVVHKKERDGRNPRTGEAIHIQAHDVIVFKAYKKDKQDKKVAKPAKNFSAKAKEKK
jgi:nucleoid DNA-binding protein